MANTYTTSQGDTWDLIALRQLGSEQAMTALIEANPTYREYVLFPAGIELTLPVVEATTTPSSLPPWKR